MKIVLISDPWIPVPPKFYGGIERVVYDLSCELHRRGHEVLLIAGPNSIAPAKKIEFGNNRAHPSKWENLQCTLKVNCLLRKLAKDSDVIHNFGRLAYLLSIGRFPVRKLHTYMREVHSPNIRMTERLAFKDMIFTAVSDHIKMGGQQGGGRWETIYNGVELTRYAFVHAIDLSTAPLVFLGRLERCKGAHNAIKVALATNRKLIIAGNISTLPWEREYFEKEIQPLIDGDKIKYIGVVNDEAKNALLGSAAALLSPIEWEEPFPIIIPESFACGTPVLAFARGGMPEGIHHGETGYLSMNVNEMIRHVEMLPKIDRKKCRLVAETRFSIQAITDEYIKVYES